MATATLCVLAGSGAARAGDEGRKASALPPEAVIGTFETTRDARAAAGKPATFDFQTEAPGQTADDDISRAYADGIDALESGKTALAQRKLEMVVARDPDGHLAKSARSYLADLYRDASRPPAVAAPAPAATATPPRFATAPSALGAGDIARQAPTPAAVSGVAVAANVEEDFIVTAGDRVFFGAGSAELGQRARIVLSAQARWMASHPEYVAVVEGHSDDGTLSDDQSAKLSEARAAAVRDRLVEEGVSPARLTLLPQGRKAPVANCPGSDCAAQNRRVVTVLKGQGRDFGLRGRGQSLASDGTRLPTQ